LVQYSTDGAVTWIDTDDGNSSATTASFINLVPTKTYVFRVAAVNAQGTGPYSAVSNAVTIVVPIITVTQQPTSQESFALAATFSTNATVTAGGTLSYQWYLVGAESSTAITGATSRTLSLTGLTGEDNGKLYQCLISTTGGGDTVATDTVSLSVPTPIITIDTTPTDQTASAGAATFTVAASVTLGATLSYQWQRGISGTYANLSGQNSATLSLTALTHNGNDGQTYRCRVSASGGAATVTSGPATLTVPAPVITIGTQPSNQTASARAASFSVAATVTDSATLSYQWQTPASGTFADISGATSATLSLSSLLYTVNDQQLYRCVVSATDGASSVVSSTATLTVPAPLITITAQPTAQTSSNQTASYSVSATVTAGQTLSYQWQRQAGAAYSNLAGKTSATLSLTGLTNTANNGDYYRCVVSATDGATPVNTDGAALTVPVPSITIGTQPTAQTASGGAASFTVAATITNGATLSYQWQRQALGTGSYSNVSGATSATLSLTGLTNLGNNQDSYRCVVSGTDNASSVTSSAATLTAPAPVITIGTQPTAQTSSNQTATFSVVASVTAGATLSYQWQRQALGTGSYAALSGQTSATLSLTGLTNAGNNSDNYRCVVSATDGATNVTSTAAALTVPVPVISITAQPEAQSTTDTAAYAVYSVSATVTNGATLSYQWQRQPSGGSFSNISGQTSSTLTLTGLTYASNNGDNYRCVVSATDNASSVTSSSAGLTVTQTPAITITSQPSNQTASSGAATFSVTATITLSATLSYQWQKQSLGTGSYANVSGATSASLSLTGLTYSGNNGDNYRCLVSGSSGAASVTSSSATLTVLNITVPGAPTSLAATSGTDSAVPLTWTAPSSNGGASITGYVVEWTPSGGSASTVSTGSTSTNYTKLLLTNGTTYTFRVAAVNSAGQGAWSSSVTGVPAASGPVFSGISTSSSSPENAYTTFTASGSGTATLAISNVVTNRAAGYHTVAFTISESAVVSYDDLHYTGSYSYDSGDVTTQLTRATNPGGDNWNGRKSGGYGFPLPWSYASAAATPARFILPAGSYKLEFAYIGNSSSVKTMNVTFTLSSSTNSVGKSFANVSGGGWPVYQGIGTNQLIIYKQTGGSRSVWWTPNTTATTIRFVIPSGSDAQIALLASSSSTLYPGWDYEGGQWSKSGLSGVTLDVPVAAFPTSGSASDKRIFFRGDTSGPVTATLLN